MRRKAAVDVAPPPFSGARKSSRKPVTGARGSRGGSKSSTRIPLFPPFGTVRFWTSIVFLVGGFGYFLTALDWTLDFRRGAGKGTPSEITPLAAPKVTSLPQFGGEYEEAMFWGTYRPHLYLGIRTRRRQSLLAGLMWIVPTEESWDLRHTCEESNRLARYGWLRHDGVSYGRQEIVDGGLFMTTTFSKHATPGGGFGGDWAVRITVRPSDEALSGADSDLPTRAALLFYVMDEGAGDVNLWPQGPRGDLTAPFAAGTSSLFGNWQLQAVVSAPARLSWQGLRTRHAHNLTALVRQELEQMGEKSGILQLTKSAVPHSNLAVLQVAAALPLQLDLLFTSGINRKDFDAAQDRTARLTGDDLSRLHHEAERAFDQRYQSTFPTPEEEHGVASQEVGKAALSNLLGGMGFFHGQSRIAVPQHLKVADGPKEWRYWAGDLFTAVPSRSFFPRGFLWDEGFHHLIIRRWDYRLSLDAMAHWLDLMNSQGWIPREQILGAEARSKVPEEFVVQHTSNANPPTLFLPILDIVERLEKGEGSEVQQQEEREFLLRSFPRLEKWFSWFNTTQLAEDGVGYYWHGRDHETSRELNPKTLTSGLDDYPRASHPSTEERHVDLWGWMALASRSMAGIARILGLPSQAYEMTAARLADVDLLNQVHLHNKSGRYYDWGLHSERVALAWKIVEPPGGGYPQRVLERHVERPPRLRLVPHFGYVSLFPLLMRLLPPDSEGLGRQLALLCDEKLLWTNFGLRSLATTSSLYMRRNTEHDAPYWRGPVWMNLNYLAIAALHHYSLQEGPHRATAGELHSQLRHNVISNVVRRYEESGYLWEQYDNSNEGAGKGSHPFTGWTALIVLIMAKIY